MAGTGSFTPCLVSSGGSTPSLGDPLVDEYLAFTAARVRPNTLPGVYLHLSNDWLARCPDAGSPEGQARWHGRLHLPVQRFRRVACPPRSARDEECALRWPPSSGTSSSPARCPWTSSSSSPRAAGGGPMSTPPTPGGGGVDRPNGEDRGHHRPTRPRTGARTVSRHRPNQPPTDPGPAGAGPPGRRPGAQGGALRREWNGGSVNRPGVSGGSVPWEGWSHVRELSLIHI